MHHRIRHWLDRGPGPLEPLHLATATGRHVITADRSARVSPDRRVGRDPSC